MIGVQKVMAVQLNSSNMMDDHFITMIGTLATLCSGVSKLFVGALLDKYSFKQLYKCVLTIQIFISSTITFVVQQNKYLYMVWVIIGTVCLGCHYVMFPKAVVTTFGLRAGPTLASIVEIGLGIGSFLTLFPGRSSSNPDITLTSCEYLFSLTCIYIFIINIIIC